MSIGEAGYLKRRHDARDDAQQQDEADADAGRSPVDIVRQIYLAPEQFAGVMLEIEGQSHTECKADRYHECRFCYQFE